MPFLFILIAVAFIASAYLKRASESGPVEKVKKMKLLSKLLPVAAIAILVISVVLGSFYSVSEDQQAVVVMFGKVQRVDGAGVHWKIPFIQTAKKVDITTHGASIGYKIEGSTQTIGEGEDPIMITADMNLIDVDFYMEYKVSDPVAYLYNSESPELILHNSAMSCIRATISDYNVDDVMTTAKGEIQSRIREKLSEEISGRQIGLQLVNIMIQDVEPPVDNVINAFKSVESAKQQADTAINNAKRYQNEKLPEAIAEADRILQAAEAAKAARIAEAEGQVARFNKMYEEYKNFPLITKKRLYYETLEDLLPGLDVVISDGNTQSILPLNPIISGGVQ